MTAVLAADPHPYAPDEERRPPASAEAEQSVLGCLLIDATRMPLCAELLDERSFFYEAHRAIWRAIDTLYRDQAPVDPVTVHAELARRDLDEVAGGMAYVQSLAQAVPSAGNARRYAEIVAQRYAERALIAAVDDARRVSWQGELPLTDRMERITSLLRRAEALQTGVGARVPLLGLEQLRASAAGVRWAVKHVVPAASVGMMFGGSGTFKSFLALDCALHVAHGRPWLGRLTQQAPVIYIAAEGGAGLWPRVHAWHRARRLGWEGVPLYVLPAAIDLQQDAWRVVDAALMLGVAPGLVVVDTLSQTYAGEENSANEMAAYLREIGWRFRDLWGCAVMLVHHTGHQATERPRGSSAIRANVDYLLGVFRDEKEMLATLTCAKQKDGELFDDAVFALEVVELGLDADGDTLTSLRALHLSSGDEVQRARQAEKAAGRGGRNMALMDLVSNMMRLQDLRKAFYELLEGADAEAKKKAFWRAKQWAEDAGLIEIREGFVADLREGA